jgi:hypothetical protein
MIFLLFLTDNNNTHCFTAGPGTLLNQFWQTSYCGIKSTYFHFYKKYIWKKEKVETDLAGRRFWFGAVQCSPKCEKEPGDMLPVASISDLSSCKTEDKNS